MWREGDICHRANLSGPAAIKQGALKSSQESPPSLKLRSCVAGSDRPPSRPPTPGQRPAAVLFSTLSSVPCSVPDMQFVVTECLMDKETLSQVPGAELIYEGAVAIQGTARLSPRGWQSPYSTHYWVLYCLLFTTQGPWSLAGTQATAGRTERLGVGQSASSGTISLSSALCCHPAAQDSHPSSKRSNPSLQSTQEPPVQRALLQPEWTLNQLAEVC